MRCKEGNTAYLSQLEYHYENATHCRRAKLRRGISYIEKSQSTALKTAATIHITKHLVVHHQCAHKVLCPSNGGFIPHEFLELVPKLYDGAMVIDI